MTTTGEQEQEQQQQQNTTASRWDVVPDGNGQGTGIDVTRRLLDTGVDMRGESGDKDYPRMSDHYDGQEVIYKYKSNQIQNNCPVSIEGRTDWLDKIIDNPQLSFETHPNSIQHQVFTFDRVIPFSHILSDTREKCTISAENNDGVQYKLQCPVRIWQAMSKRIYTKLKVKIPHELRRFHQTVNKNDGEALVKSIRTTCDNISHATAQLLELRKDSIKFTNLSDWIQVRGDFFASVQRLPTGGAYRRHRERGWNLR